MSQTFSLRGRMLWSAALVLFVFLGLTGIVLDQAFQRSAEQSVAEKLRVQIYGLLSVTEVIDGELMLPEALQEPGFNHPGSGLFALALSKTGEELWRSPSAVTLDNQTLEAKVSFQTLSAGDDEFGRTTTGDFYLAYKVLWLGSGDEARELVFVVMESPIAFSKQLDSFRSNLWGWLLLAAIALISVQALVMSWGLKPLGSLATDLAAIENGDQDTLVGRYPEELTGVTRNLNILIASERTQREKYRTTMADLAHSIKTPLAILKGSANQLQDAGVGESVQATIDEQVGRMDDIIAYQLERAMTDASKLIKRSIEVKAVTSRLVSALSKVYPTMKIEARMDEANFFGDERDLMELLGNLLDNACKYGEKEVALLVRSKGQSGVIINVEDDGPGIPPERREQVLERGARLDSRMSGQGIGLAVVTEIVDRYHGAITIGDSELGGARLQIEFV